MGRPMWSVTGGWKCQLETQHINNNASVSELMFSTWMCPMSHGFSRSGFKWKTLSTSICHCCRARKANYVVGHSNLGSKYRHTTQSILDECVKDETLQKHSADSIVFSHICFLGLRSSNPTWSRLAKRYAWVSGGPSLRPNSNLKVGLWVVTWCRNTSYISISAQKNPSTYKTRLRLTCVVIPSAGGKKDLPTNMIYGQGGVLPNGLFFVCLVTWPTGAGVSQFFFGLLFCYFGFFMTL